MTAAFNPVITQAGLNALARAQAEGRSVTITHVALGTGVYAPNGSETALRQEIGRWPIDRRVHLGDARWQVLSRITHDGTVIARELGYYARDEGRDVLMFVHSDDQSAVAALTVGQETLLDLQLNLQAIPDGLVEITMLDTDLMEQDVLDDMTGLHQAGGQFNFALTRSVEERGWTALEAFEAVAQSRREGGQSGLTLGRHYALGGDAPWHRPSVVGFAAQAVHDHPNYPFMGGVAELSACINGYQFSTRHCDFTYATSIAGAYLEMDRLPAPSVPGSVLSQATPGAQTDEMREYIRAFAQRDPAIRDYRDHFDTALAVLECWLEDLTDDQVAETFPSFRHAVPDASKRRINEDFVASLATGLKPRFENLDWKPSVIRIMGRDGAPRFAVLRYRIQVVRLGTYRAWPIHQMVEQVDDPMTRRSWFDGQDVPEAGRHARYRIRDAIGPDPEIMARRHGPGLLDDIMARVAGLDGAGAVIAEEFKDTNDKGALFTQTLREWKSDQQLNGGVYKRYYSLGVPGAAGRKDYRFGYNDPMLFRAASTRPEVAKVGGLGGHRMSWAVPLELIAIPPWAGWNPHGVTEIEGKPTGTGKTAGTAYGATSEGGYNYRTPFALFDGAAQQTDPADTHTAAWVLDRDGVAQQMWGSGMYVHFPAISGAHDPKGRRLRWPIAPHYHEGSLVHAHAVARDQETRDAIALLVARNIQTETRLAEIERALDTHTAGS